MPGEALIPHTALRSPEIKMNRSHWLSVWGFSTGVGFSNCGGTSSRCYERRTGHRRSREAATERRHGTGDIPVSYVVSVD